MYLIFLCLCNCTLIVYIRFHAGVSKGWQRFICILEDKILVYEVQSLRVRHKRLFFFLHACVISWPVLLFHSCNIQDRRCNVFTKHSLWFLCCPNISIFLSFCPSIRT